MVSSETSCLFQVSLVQMHASVISDKRWWLRVNALLSSTFSPMPSDALRYERPDLYLVENVLKKYTLEAETKFQCLNSVDQCLAMLLKKIHFTRICTGRLIGKIVSDMKDVWREANVALTRLERFLKCSPDIKILVCIGILLVAAFLIHSQLALIYGAREVRRENKVKYVESPNNYIRELFHPNCDQGTNISEYKVREVKRMLSDTETDVRTGDCKEYFANFPVEASGMTDQEFKAERNFTFAFSHQVHKSAGILELLLSILYRYINSYLRT